MSADPLLNTVDRWHCPAQPLRVVTRKSRTPNMKKVFAFLGCQNLALFEVPAEFPEKFLERQWTPLLDTESPLTQCSMDSIPVDQIRLFTLWRLYEIERKEPLWIIEKMIERGDGEHK